MPDFLKMLQHLQKLPNLGIYPDPKSEAYKTTQSYPVTNIHTIYFKHTIRTTHLNFNHENHLKI